MELEQFGKGKCINCGFLGKNEREESVSVCYESTPHDRETCTFNHVRGHISVFPCCFLGKTTFSWDFYGKTDLQLLSNEIHYERNCQYWFPYTKFRNPQQHYEEYKMMQLERQRREFEEKMEKDRKKFELELDKRNQQERKRTDIIMIVLAVAAIIFAILQLTSDSWVVQYFQGIAGMVK